jgi:kumamolisin
VRRRIFKKGEAMAQIPPGYKPLLDSERHLRAGARLVGPADPDEVLSITIRVRRRPDAPPLPDLTRVGTPVTLPPAAFATTYGALPGDLERVTDFARGAGLAVVDTDIARRSVVLKGTVAQMSQAFGVDLGRYRTADETYRGREGPLHLPDDLQDVVEGVFGLDNRRMARHSMALSPRRESGTARTLTPPQVAGLYQFPTPLNAAGETIGLLEFGGGYAQADITGFYSSIGLEPPQLTAVSVNGVSNSPGSQQQPNPADDEVALDIDVAGAVAQQSEIAVYFSSFDENGWVQAVTTAVYPKAGQPAPSVISISWGWPELEPLPGTTFAWSKAAITAVSETFQEAAAQGITVFAASGDHGSSCGQSDRRAHALYPGSDPWVTSCGGTLLTNVSAATFDEGTWQDNNGWATGGGVSDVFVPGPPWQASTNTPGSVNDGHKGRTLPDVAGNADSASGYNVLVYGTAGAVGGTSAVAPLYAGLAALLNAKLGKHVGFLNPTLYSDPTLFRDVADGISNATDGAQGYSSTAGYDACTGWGSVVGVKLLAKFGGQP